MVRLEEINGKNVWNILKLRVSETQRSFVAPNDVSLIEAYIAITHHGQAFPFGIYDDETPVGFCTVGFGADDDWEDAPAIAKNPMYLILNLIRVLAYLKQKNVMSKREAGMWGLEFLPEQYRPLIRSALQEYENGNNASYDVELARNYAAYMLKQITTERNQECV